MRAGHTHHCTVRVGVGSDLVSSGGDAVQYSIRDWRSGIGYDCTGGDGGYYCLLLYNWHGYCYRIAEAVQAGCGERNGREEARAPGAA